MGFIEFIKKLGGDSSPECLLYRQSEESKELASRVRWAMLISFIIGIPFAFLLEWLVPANWWVGALFMYFIVFMVFVQPSNTNRR